MPPLPYDGENERRRRDHAQHHDELRFKPVVTLSLVEDDLKRTQPDRDQPQAHVVNASLAPLAAAEFGRVLNQTRRQQQGENPHRDVNEENPTPAEIVGDPSAQRWTDGRSHHHRSAVNRKGHTPFCGSERVGKNRLFAGLETASPRTLHDPEDDEHGQVGSESAESRTDRKQRNASHIEPLASNEDREPCADGENDCVRDQIAG